MSQACLGHSMSKGGEWGCQGQLKPSHRGADELCVEHSDIWVCCNISLYLKSSLTIVNSLFPVYTGEKEVFRKAEVSVSPCYITICQHFKIKYSSVTSESSRFPSHDIFLSSADYLCFEKAFKPCHLIMPLIPRLPLSQQLPS